MINVVEINDPYAGMVELADASDSKSEGSNTVSVRPRLPAPKKQRASLALARCFFVSAIGQPIAIRKECTESHLNSLFTTFLKKMHLLIVFYIKIVYNKLISYKRRCTACLTTLYLHPSQ